MVHRAIAAIKVGENTSDKLKIVLNESIQATWPFVHAVHRLTGRIIYQPSDIIKEMRCKTEYGKFVLPASCFWQLIPQYEPDVKGVIQSLKGGLFMDVGANVGTYSVMASRLAGKVIAIEPDPFYFSYLRKNIALNGCKNVEVWNLAGGFGEDRVAFYPHKFGVSKMDSSLGSNGEPPIQVETKTLDSILGGRIPELVKIDAEGAEFSILSGLTTKTRIIFEVLQFEMESLGLLEKRGYSVSKLSDGNYLAVP